MERSNLVLQLIAASIFSTWIYIETLLLMKKFSLENVMSLQFVDGVRTFYLILRKGQDLYTITKLESVKVLLVLVDFSWETLIKMGKVVELFARDCFRIAAADSITNHLPTVTFDAFKELIIVDHFLQLKQKKKTRFNKYELIKFLLIKGNVLTNLDT
jgi:hypothetical protein